MIRAELVIPCTPPSLNQIGSRGSRWAYSKAKGQLESYIIVSLYQAQLPKKLKKITATASLRFPSRHRRDEGNYRFLLEKALGDALVHRGHIADDVPEQYRFGALDFEDERGSHRTTIVLVYE